MQRKHAWVVDAFSLGVDSICNPLRVYGGNQGSMRCIEFGGFDGEGLEGFVISSHVRERGGGGCAYFDFLVK